MAIDTLKQEEGAVEEGEGVGDVDTTRDIISENELQLFCDSLSNTLQNTASFKYTLDYFDPSIGILYSKDHPTCLNFCVALLREILCNLKPNHELWDKIQYAAFLLNLATRNVEFSVLYEIYHQIEDEIIVNKSSWHEVRETLDKKITEKLIVKDDVCSLPDLDDRKCDIDLEGHLTVDRHDEDPSGDRNNDDEAFLNGVHNGDHENDDMYREDDGFGDACDDNFDVKEEEMPVKKKKTATKRKAPAPKKERKVTPKEKKPPQKRRRKKVEYNEGNGSDYDICDNLDNPEEPPISEVKRRKKGAGSGQGKVKSVEGGDDDRPRVPCLQCKFKAKSQQELERHAFEKHQANRLCTQCGHLSDTYKDYIKHNETHLFTCEVCHKKILGVRVLRAHMKLHETKQETETKQTAAPSEAAKVPCDICGVLLLEISLKHHINQVHSNEIHKCDLCDFTANTKYKITDHRKRHFVKTSDCPECGKTVKNLKRHFRRNCAGKRERHYCHLCEKSFSFKESLNKHIKSIHQKIMDHHCHLCEYKTYKKFNLKLHISKMHTKEEMNKVCQYCQQKTSNLEYHINIYHYDDKLRHEDKINKVCPYCNEKTGSLEQHIKTYHSYHLKNNIGTDLQSGEASTTNAEIHV